MNKNEALWVIIRATGLVFLILALMDFVKLVLLFSYYLYTSDVISAIGSVSNTSAGKEMAIDIAMASISQNISSLLLYSLTSYYFMRKGKFVHGIIAK